MGLFTNNQLTRNHRIKPPIGKTSVFEKVIDMCDWCTQHGDGKKWYLNVKNYSKDSLKDEAAVEEWNLFLQNVESFMGVSPQSNIGISGITSDEEYSEVVGNGYGCFLPTDP